MRLCRPCAEWAFACWRGWCSVGTEAWKEKPDLPAVPTMDDGRCSRCGGSDGLNLDQVFYRNVHGPHNTGLPDYFELVIMEHDEFNARRWGRPYSDAWITARVSLDDLESHMKRSRYG
jgi:hypothetical protein